MTEAELWELILLSQGNVTSVAAIYFTVLSGYLIVAYLVGQKLTTTQFITVTGLFTAAELLLTLGFYAFVSRAAFLMQFTEETYRSPASQFISPVPWGIVVFSLGGIAACLKFMWDVRNPEIE